MPVVAPPLDCASDAVENAMAAQTRGIVRTRATAAGTVLNDILEALRLRLLLACFSGERAFSDPACPGGVARNLMEFRRGRQGCRHAGRATLSGEKTAC